MAEKKLLDNKWVKLGITVAVVAAAAGLTYLVAKKIIKELVVRDPSKDLGKDLGKEINTSKLSYTQSQYQTMSDSIYRAMNEGGTNWPTVVRVIKQIKNSDDWKQLVITFGIKKSTSMWSSFSGNLVEWIEDELSGSEMTEISGILSKVGVTF